MVNMSKDARQPITDILLLLKKPGDVVYLGTKQRCYVHIYLRRIMKTRNDWFQFTVMNVKPKNKEHLEYPMVYEVYRVT